MIGRSLCRNVTLSETHPPLQFVQCTGSKQSGSHCVPCTGSVPCRRFQKSHCTLYQLSAMQTDSEVSASYSSVQANWSRDRYVQALCHASRSESLCVHCTGCHSDGIGCHCVHCMGSVSCRRVQRPLYTVHLAGSVLRGPDQRSLCTYIGPCPTDCLW
jgi:hypothetical protein